MPIKRIVNPEAGDGLLTDHLVGDIRRVLVVFFHGVGDVVNFIMPFLKLRELYPHVHFDLGLIKGLDQEAIFPDSMLLDGDWRENDAGLDYDIAFLCHFPMEDINRPTVTKAEISCERELGIGYVSAEPQLFPKRLVGVHFHATALPGIAGADEEPAKRVWDDIIAAGCVPLETHFEHVFHNPVNAKFGFVDNHVRCWPARLETLMALLGSCSAFVGVVSGNFHLALSILGPSRVLLLEKESRGTQFTKQRIATASLKNYQGEVKQWLQSLE